MVKMQAAVGRGIIDSSINSPLCQKFSFKSKSNYKNNKKAFSVAEATIALLIGSVALGMAAPMITKQVKIHNMTDTQNRVLVKRMQELEEQLMPDGMVRFFYNRTCPNGWTPVPDLDGRYIRLTSDADEIGATYEASLPNIKGGFPGVGQFIASKKFNDYTEEDKNEVANGLVKPKDGLSGAFYRLNKVDQPKYGVMVANDGSQRDDYFAFDAHNYNSIYGAAEAEVADATEKDKKVARNEVRPRTITFIACVRTN